MLSFQVLSRYALIDNKLLNCYVYEAKFILICGRWLVKVRSGVIKFVFFISILFFSYLELYGVFYVNLWLMNSIF
jgi:hypothetical protein